MAKFQKGNKGQPKGAVNKVTQEAKEIVKDVFIGQLPNINVSLEEVREKSHKDYLELMIKLAQFFIPKQTENTNNNNHSLNDFDIKEVFGFDNNKE